MTRRHHGRRWVPRPGVLVLVTSLYASLAVDGWAASGGEVASGLDVLRGLDQQSGFALAAAPHTFAFPQDQGPHTDFRHEWWYLTGHLDTPGGERFGFELTFFRVALQPPGVVPMGDEASGWRARQIYTAHFALTDASRGVFRFAQKYSRGALGLADAQADPFRVWLDDWSLGASNIAGAGDQAGVSAATVWQVHAAGAGYEIRLDAQPLMSPVLNGDRGLSRKSDEPGAASYYYSMPRIAVHGALFRDGRRLEVHGLAWLDREWGSGSLGRRQQGWDWFALQLQNGSTLMFYALRNRDGTRDPHSAGTFVDAEGSAHPLTNEDVHLSVGDYWRSPRGVRYPASWKISVPSLGLEVQAKPVLADQELRTQPRYWEGAVDVRGVQSAHAIAGRGYVELVGYGE